MKKGLILGLVLGLLGSCDIKIHKDPVKTKELNSAIRIIEVDGCEYIQSDVYSGYSICHKGNCKFCLKRNNK